MNHGSPPRQQQPQDVIERLMIFHHGLPGMCGGLDEGSSRDELSEHILFYHDSLLKSEDDAAPEDLSRSGDAINFVGICTALLSLPGAFAAEQERTTEVQLEHSTIVFCPVEESENPDIMVVMQVKKGVGHTLAVRTSIQRCHDLYSLFRGGSIHHRLSSRHHVPSKTAPKDAVDYVPINTVLSGEETPPEEAPPDMSMRQSLELPLKRPSITAKKESKWEDDGCVYPGMSLLYKLRKQARKAKEKISRVSPIMPVKKASLETELEETDVRITSLLRVLPIQSLRDDLQDHYKEYLEEIRASSSGSLRCIVEDAKSLPSTQESQRKHPSMMATIQLGRTIQTVLEKSCHVQAIGRSVLLGVTTFFEGSIIYSHYRSELPGTISNFSVSNTTASQLYSHLSSFQNKMEQRPRSRTGFLTPSRPPRLKNVLNKQMSRIQERLPRRNKDGSDPEPSSVFVGQYLEPPPLAMLNASARVCEIEIDARGRVWTPFVQIPYDSQGATCYHEINVAFFTMEDFSLLFYLDTAAMLHAEPTAHNNDVAKILDEAAGSLSVCIANIESFDRAAAGRVEPSAEEQWRGPGLDVVFIDRVMGRLEVFESLENGEHTPSKGFGAAKGLKWIKTNVLPKEKGREAPGNGSPTGKTHHRRQFRNKVASVFPDDALDAIDDIMGLISERRPTDGQFELCSYLQSGWIWSFANNRKEVYALLCPTVYVTISDVKKKCDELRGAFFGLHCS